MSPCVQSMARKIITAIVQSLLLLVVVGFHIMDNRVTVQAFHFGKISIFSDVFTSKSNSSKPINQFDPLNREIYSGDVIKWSNPTAGKPYPHTVTFISNESNTLESKISNITRTFQSSDLQSLVGNLNKLVTNDDGQKNNNTRTFDGTSIIFPSVINSSNFNVTYLNASGNALYKGAEYNFTGNETYLNSGLIWTGGVIPDGFPKINSFIVAFDKPGTYHYQCLLYPEMKGTITVKPNAGLLGHYM